MVTPFVATRLEQGVLSLRLDRPEKKNALIQPMYQALLDGLRRAARDPEIAVVLLSGEGDSFCAGNAIEEFFPIIAGDPAYARGREFLHELAHFEKPIVAAVQGDTAGIGATMLLHCDLVYAAEDTRFLLPFVQIGAVAEGASSLLLPLHVGHRAASELLLLGEPVSASRGLALGLYNDVVANTELMAVATAKAHRLRDLPQNAVMATKRLLRNTWRDRLSDVIDREILVFVDHLRSNEAQTRLEAFLSKRRRAS